MLETAKLIVKSGTAQTTNLAIFPGRKLARELEEHRSWKPKSETQLRGRIMTHQGGEK